MSDKPHGATPRRLREVLESAHAFLKSVDWNDSTSETNAGNLMCEIDEALRTRSAVTPTTAAPLICSHCGELFDALDREQTAKGTVGQSHVAASDDPDIKPLADAIAGVLDADQDIGMLHSRADIPLMTKAEWWRVVAVLRGEISVRSAIEPNQIIEKCAQIVEMQGRKSPTIDGQSFYIATGQAAAAIRSLKDRSPGSTSVFHPYCELCKKPAPSSGGCAIPDCGIRRVQK